MGSDSRDTMLSPTDRLEKRLALRSADTKPLDAATPPGVERPSTMSVPVPGSNPAIERTSSRAPEPFDAHERGDLAGRDPEVDVLELAAPVGPATELHDRCRDASRARVLRTRSWPPSETTTSSRAMASWVERLALERERRLAVEDDHDPVRCGGPAPPAGG